MLSCKSAVNTRKSNYGLKLSIILMFLTIYGVEKSQCDRSTEEIVTITNNNNDDNDDLVCEKMKVFPLFCVATRTCRYNTEKDISE